MSVMFYGMTAWIFRRKDGRISNLVSLLMATICLECIKDMFFFNESIYDNEYYICVMTSVDMVAVPMYTSILKELIKPGQTSLKKFAIHEIPFVTLPLAYIITHQTFFYETLVVWAAIYGTFYLIWATVNIPKYNRHLMERFSYTENINLNWLKHILYTFYVILALWIIDCLMLKFNVAAVYMLGSLALWITVDYYIYKHESVLDELTDDTASKEDIPENVEEAVSELNQKITQLFIEEKAYLNPQLKISDVAKAVGTNRTYVSNFFNKDAGTTFYDYVNTLRVGYACRLLADSDESIKNISEQSGFSSQQAFYRVFARIKGMTPATFRNSVKSID